MEVKWEVALYLDEKANSDQRDALAKIFSGQAGGHFAALGPLIGKVLGVRNVSIEYAARGNRRNLRIAGVGEAEIEAVAGQGGAEVKVSGNPLTVVPGEPAVVARSKRLQYSDYGMTWEFSDRNGFYSPFKYAGP